MTDMRFTECIRRIQSGDRKGLEDIYSEYYKLIYSAALAVTGNRTDAEDTVSDYFVKLWIGISQGKIRFDGGKAGHKRWLAVTARNLALDNMRRQHPSDELTEEDAPSESPEESMIDCVRVKEALSSLDESEREVVHLKHFGGFTLKEISEILSVPQGTAAWKYRTAAEKLKKILGEAF